MAQKEAEPVAQQTDAPEQRAQKLRAPERIELPRIRLEAHSPISSISRIADHARIPGEGFYADARSADLNARLAGNVQRYLPEGAQSLHSRLQAVLERL